MNIEPDNIYNLDCIDGMRQMGSGTTAIAAKQTGRRYIGFEKSPYFHQMAMDRLGQQVLTPFCEVPQ